MSLRRFFRRAKWDSERREELESYIQIETDENIARGMPVEAARKAALRKLGNPILVREEIYIMNTIGFIDAFGHDLRYAWRGLMHNPVFTIAALLTLSIGIGANTAVFSVINSVLLNPLPYPKADELVAVWQTAPGAPGLTSVSGDLRLSASMYFTYSEENRTFQRLGVWAPVTSTVTGLGDPEQLRTLLVSDGALQALAVPPLHGRWLSSEDQKPGAAQAVMINYGYFQRRFGADPSVVGKTVIVDASPRQIVGVMPRGFRVADADFDLILPFAFDRSKVILPGFGFQGIGRLKPGVTIAEADADLARMLPIWMDSWPFPFPGVNPHVYESWKITPAIRPLKNDVLGNIANSLWIVMETVGLVMLTACANVATLLLVRAETRQQELAIRAALGSGWLRIVRELLVESLLLALLGGALGLAIASAGIALLVRIGPATLPRLAEISIDSRALGFTLVISLLSGLAFGLLPALKYAGPGIARSLRLSGRTFTGSRERHRIRNILSVTQVALALLLLISSGLMIRTFERLRAVEPGFGRPEELQLVETAIPNQLIREPE